MSTRSPRSAASRSAFHLRHDVRDFVVDLGHHRRVSLGDAFLRLDERPLELGGEQGVIQLLAELFLHLLELLVFRLLAPLILVILDGKRSFQLALSLDARHNLRNLVVDARALGRSRLLGVQALLCRAERRAELGREQGLGGGRRRIVVVGDPPSDSAARARTSLNATRGSDAWGRARAHADRAATGGTATAARHGIAETPRIGPVNDRSRRPRRTRDMDFPHSIAA